MQKYRIYELYFLIALPLLVLSLIWNWLQLIYAVAFFLATLDLIFITIPINDKTKHSSVNYYQRSSRWNWFNYTLIGLLIVEAFMFTIIPVGQALIVLASWAINILIIRRLIQSYGSSIVRSMVSGYLKQQIPDLAPHKFDMALDYLAKDTDPSTQELSIFAGISVKDADDIIHYFKVYNENNN